MDEYIFEAEATVGEQKVRAVVTVGRFQPPTRGHYKVIGAMKAFVRDNPDLKLDARPIVVVVEGKKTSADKSKNPLTAEERIHFMSHSGRANGVTFLTASSAFDAFEQVRKAGFEPIAVAAGSDRAAGYIKMLDKYFKAADDAPITHHAVPGLQRDVDDDIEDGETAFDTTLDMIDDGEEIPDSQVSGSLARHAAVKNRLGAFMYITGLEKNPVIAKKMFAKVRDAQKE